MSKKKTHQLDELILSVEETKYSYPRYYTSYRACLRRNGVELFSVSDLQEDAAIDSVWEQAFDEGETLPMAIFQELVRRKLAQIHHSMEYNQKSLADLSYTANKAHSRLDNHAFSITAGRYGRPKDGDD